VNLAQVAIFVLDKIPEPDDIAKAKATAAEKDFQTASEELPTSKADEH
jgi:hypothetical protein